MGGVCSGGMAKRSRKEVGFEHDTSSNFSGKLNSKGSLGRQNYDDGYDVNSDVDYNEYGDELFEKKTRNLYDSGELFLSISRELKPSTPARTHGNKNPQVTSFLGKARVASLEKAVEVLDTLGSSMTNLNSGGFNTGVNSRGNKISILAFEVANTIAKGTNLLQSLSEESIQVMKKEVLSSEGVKRLVSTDTNELLRLAASDKREEFDVFSREVIRFGNLCKDPQWHNLDRFFAKLDADTDFQKQSLEETEMTMHELTTLAQYTSELYHELHALDRFEQDYQRKLDEVTSLNLPRKGEALTMLLSELKHQRKLVRSLKKKSLWSRSLEQIMEKLVDIVTFIHQEISDVFGDNGLPKSDKGSSAKPERLGPAGLALHYANIITQIDNIASRPTSLPPNMRDTLYNGLPPNVKSALRSEIQLLDAKEKLTVPQIKAEMEKTLGWLVPVATDTTKAHQGFGWVGEWANTGHEFGKKSTAPNAIVRLQTLYHADKGKVESCILGLITLLHRLIILVRYRDNGVRTLPFHAPSRMGSSKLTTFFDCSKEPNRSQLSAEDRDLLENVMSRRRKFLPGLSKSQEFATAKEKKIKFKVRASSRSTGNSPEREVDKRRNAIDVLDVLDGLDSKFSVAV